MKMNELHNQPVEADTYEASMALNQLLKIGKHAVKIHNMIDDSAEMEAWVAKKIDLAGDYVKKVHGYMQGEKAGLYDDGGLTEGMGEKIANMAQNMSKNEFMSHADELGLTPEEAAEYYAKMQGGAYASKFEDAGEQALANELSKYYQDSADGYDPEDKGNDEHEEQEYIAREFKKGLQAGMDAVNISSFEFSGNDFDVGKDGRGEVHYQMADLLKKYGVSAGINKKSESYLIKDGKAITDPGHWNKRFEGMAEDAGEGHMSKSTLYHTAKYAIELMDMINKGDDLEGWVQSKLNKAADYLQGVHNYEEYQKLNPYREELDANILQRHAGIVQKHIDEILAKETKLDDVDTKPGMMRILAKRVNEVEKEIAKEQRKDTDEEAPPGREKQVKALKKKFKDKGAPYAIAWAQHNKHGKPKKEDEINEDPRAVGKALGTLKYGRDMAQAILDGEDPILLKSKAQAYLGGIDQTLGMLNNMYSKKNEGGQLEEGIKEWGKRLAMAGVIVAGLAGVNSVQDAIDRSVPAVAAMEKALEMAQDQGNDELAKMIKGDLSAVKVRLSSGKDLNFVKGMQEKYSKFIQTEGLAYESRLAVRLEQRIK